MESSQWAKGFERYPSAPRGNTLVLRLAIIILVLAVMTGLFLYAGGWLSPHLLTSAKIVDTFERLNGVHPGFRRNHPKGVCVAGYFESNGKGQFLSEALLFRPGRVPIVGRFSLAGGQPYAADTPETVRSLAILFKLANGEEWRTAMINIPVFLVNTPTDFHDFLVASSPDPSTGKVNAEALNTFLLKHPETAAALKLIGNHPFSPGFGDSPYYALNAFRFVNSKGKSTPVRWWVKPDQFFAGNPRIGDKDYLFDALSSEIHSHPLHWQLILTIGQPGDPTAKAASPWPSDREQIDVGTVTFESIESEDTSPTRDITFDPLVLPEGISPSDDPLLTARSATYSQSFRRREGERKAPSAISNTEVRR